MDRTNGLGFVLDANGHRERVPLNISTGTAGTELDPNYDNDLQEEVVGGLLEYTGLAPTSGAQRQVQQALFRLFGGNATAVTASLTLTPDQSGLVEVYANGGNVTLTLPAPGAANGAPFGYSFVRTDTSANTVVIVTAGGSLNIYPGGISGMALTFAAPVDLRTNGSTIWRVGSAAPRVTVDFYSNGSWTAPGVTQAWVTLVGAGGGGGYGPYAAAGGGGGGGQSMLRQLVSITPGATYPIYVGAFGLGGTSGAAATAGGASSFGSLLTALGGGAGAMGVTETAVSGGALGGLFASTGGYGFGNDTYQIGGTGGGNLMGNGGFPGVGGAPPGAFGGGLGAGGGGGANQGNGGAGTNGFASVEY